MGVAVIIGYRPRIQDVVLEMFGLKLYVAKFCWYVSFYIVLLVSIPLYVKTLKIKNELKWDIIISVAFCVLIRLLADTVNKYDKYDVMSSVALYMPIAIMGYIMTKYNILDRINNKLQRLNDIVKILMGIFMIAIVLFIHSTKPFVKGISSGIVLVPILLLAIAIIRLDCNNRIAVIIKILGKYSMNIWFLHCLFFSQATREVFQPIAYIIKNSVFVVIWILLICTLTAVPIQKIQEKLIHKAWNVRV